MGYNIQLVILLLLQYVINTVWDHLVSGMSQRDSMVYFANLQDLIVPLGLSLIHYSLGGAGGINEVCYMQRHIHDFR